MGAKTERGVMLEEHLDDHRSISMTGAHGFEETRLSDTEQ